ncbi:hypothetical protein [Thaumasiovibrio sp. DFM-14]
MINTLFSLTAVVPIASEAALNSPNQLMAGAIAMVAAIGMTSW